jgi:hypothetical protein
MIAIVTSTIKPTQGDDPSRSLYTFKQRLEQTKHTLTRLKQCGFKSIYLLDNSPSLDASTLQSLLNDIADVKVYHLLQYQFKNKGINELLMLLFITELLPKSETIFKISGRYYPTETFDKPHFTDFAAKAYGYNTSKGTISTRGYWIKDADTMHCFLKSCLDEVYTYPARIVGLRSLYNKLGQRLFNKPFTPVNISIEFAAANVLKRSNYKVTLLNTVNIEGLVAGADKLEKITE